MERTKKREIYRVTDNAIERTSDELVVERHITLHLDGRELVRTTCSPGQMRDWVVGYLYSEGWIGHVADVAAIHETESGFEARLATSAPGQQLPTSHIASDFTVNAQHLLEVARKVECCAELFSATGGSHVMAIIDSEGRSHLAEDISRNCALEKAIGIALREAVPFRESIAFLSSRVPSAMISKLARCGIPIVAAVSAPTHDAAQLAEALRICLCGFVRKDRWNAYTHAWRVGL